MWLLYISCLSSNLNQMLSSLFFSRLYVLQGGLAQQEWRVPELLHRLLQYLEPKLTQVYKNVSERIGRYVLECKNQVNINMYFHHVQSFQSHYLLLLILSLVLSLSVLTYIFMIDVNLPHTQPTTSPRIAEFTERVLVRLKPLTEGKEEIQNHVVEENTEGDQNERTQAIKLLKTGVYSVCLSVCVCMWLLECGEVIFLCLW